MNYCSMAAVAALALMGNAQGATIENERLRLSVGEDGSIVDLYDKERGIELVTTPKQSRLFELMIPDEANYSHRIDSRLQGATVHVSGQQIDVLYPSLRPVEDQIRFGSGLMHFPQPQLAIEVKVSLRLENDQVMAALSLSNGSDSTISGVIFPFVGGLAANLSGNGGQITAPSTSQRRYMQTQGPMSGEHALRYPAVLSSSWVNIEYGGATHKTMSLALEARTGLEAQDAFFALSPGPFGAGSAYASPYEYPFIAWVQYPHIPPHQEWQSSVILLHIHHGDWHGVAAEHREWFRQSHHLVPSSRWRDDIGFASYLLKDEENKILWNYGSLGELSRIAQTAGFRRVVVDGWRSQEGAGNPAPFGEIADSRLGGAIGLRETMQTARKAGVSLIFAYHPTLFNQVAGRFPPELSSWTVHTRRHGRELRVDALSETNDYPSAMTGNSLQLEIDPSSAAQDFFIADIDRLRRDYDMESLLLRGVGQQAYLSYDNQRGLAPQSAYPQGYSALLGKMRSMLPQGLLITEGMNDLVDSFVDGAYLWDPSRDGRVLSYSLPWQHFSRDVEALDYMAANRAFVDGMLINLLIDGGAGTVARYPRFAAHLSGLQRLKQTAPAPGELEFRDHEGALTLKESASITWANYADAPGRRHVTLIANLCDCDSSAEFDFRGEARMANQHRMDGSSAAVILAGSDKIALKPNEVVAVSFGTSP
jgi:hypothetical protein